MQHVTLSLLLIINLSISLFASNATTQEHLVSLSPIEGVDNVRLKSLVKVTFDRAIIESSVKNRTITLKPINPEAKKVSAKITISDKSTLVFTPDELLQEGLYRVKINPVKLQADKDDYQLSSFTQKILYWLCSLFYGDISECPLYKKFYKAPSFIKTKLIQYTFSVLDRPELLSIKLNTTLLELNEGETAQLNAVANYDDNSTKDVTKEALWSVDYLSVASIDTNATLNAIQEGSAQITATLENITSQILSLSVRKVINGHVLPPQPDKTLNDSTLLGIDVNNNGVRDDVERWIYETYKDKHPIHIDIAMQAGRAWQKVLEDPNKAKEIHDLVRAPGGCQRYYMNDAKYFKEPILVYERIITGYFIHKILFNTNERERTFLQYDKLLSGDSYTLPRSEERKALCDFNTSKYEE